MREYRQSVAVVTGASSGIGRRLALDLAARGATVVGLARREPLLQELGLPYRVCDVSDTERFTTVLGEIEAERTRIDILVNNAGLESDSDVEKVTLDEFRTTFETNFFAAVAGTLAVLPGMLTRGDGVVLNVSSDSGRAPGPGSGAYAASKAALSAFTESLSFETEGRGVHLHVLYPGWVPTAMGQRAVDDGMPPPPKAVRRSEEQVSDLVLRRLGTNKVDINAAPVALLAPVARALFPTGYRRGVRRASR